jgi:hypothetical protein
MNIDAVVETEVGIGTEFKFAFCGPIQFGRTIAVGCVNDAQF